MHDIRAIRADPAAFDAALARRGLPPLVHTIIGLDEKRRLYSTNVQAAQAERKALSKLYARRLAMGETPEDMQEKAARIDASLTINGSLLEKAEKELRDRLAALPNILASDVPPGADEASNVVLKQWGEPRRFDFQPLEHFELGERLGQMDFERAARLSGSRFTVLRGGLARLERALGQFMLDLHVDAHGYTEAAVPLLVNDAAVYGTNQLPKFKDDLFRTEDGRWLIPTAEVPLTNMVAAELVPEAALPLRLAALSDCFRSEAGAAGRDTRGMLRQHQFRKVELVSITRPEEGEAEHERMTACAEAVLERLGLPYRRVLLCAGDTGFGAAKTHDLEVWLPGQGAWREISSCSNMQAFQARRMNARFRGADGKSAGFVHTLNGSGVAVGRALIAVMENHQQADGSIEVPEALRHYMRGLERVGPA